VAHRDLHLPAYADPIPESEGRAHRVGSGRKTQHPSPDDLFAVWWARPWHPDDFLGSWVLELTAHSDVLQQFDGGDGTVAIHGRGGASLQDPLGTALSHGCIRPSNDAIDRLVQIIGLQRLPGTPVQIS
jgi:lipoprotein-anchoring transpeptidase ErfK/SrfK